MTRAEVLADAVKRLGREAEQRDTAAAASGIRFSTVVWCEVHGTLYGCSGARVSVWEDEWRWFMPGEHAPYWGRPYWEEERRGVAAEYRLSRPAGALASCYHAACRLILQGQCPGCVD